MATSVFAPAYELSGTPTSITSAFAVNGLLDDWYTQTYFPVANTPNGQWLMDQVVYVKPQNRITPGREYPTK